MTELSRDFKGIWIPKEIWLGDLTVNEKALLAEVDSLDKGDGCFASNEYLAGFIGISKQSLANLVSRLHQKGYLVTRRFDGRTRWMSVVTRKSESIEGCMQGSSVSEGRVHSEMNHRDKGENKEESETPHGGIVESEAPPSQPPPAVKPPPPPKPKRDAYGEMGRVMLAPEEYAKLVSKYGETKTKKAIEVLDGYIASKKRDPYACHYAVMKEGSWVWERVRQTAPTYKGPNI